MIVQTLSHFPVKHPGIYIPESEKRLRTLFILLGLGCKIEKIRLLFHLYACNSHKSISEAELTKMIESLLLINLVCIPRLALSRYGNKVTMNSMVSTLKCLKHWMLKEIVRSIQFIKLMKFRFVVSLFKNRNIGLLLEPNELRLYTLVKFEERIQYRESEALMIYKSLSRGSILGDLKRISLSNNHKNI
jgi:hypothetical protein